MPHRDDILKLEEMASKAVAHQVVLAGLIIDSLPDRHDLTPNTGRGSGSKLVQEQELSPFHSKRAKKLTISLANFLQEIPVFLLEKVVNDIEYGCANYDFMDRKLMSTIINVDRSRLSDLCSGLHAVLCALTKTGIKKLNFNRRCLEQARSFDQIGDSKIFAKTIQRCLVHFENLTYCNLFLIATDNLLMALSDSCPKLKHLIVDRSRITDNGLMHLAGVGKGVRRKLLDDNPSPRRTGCFDLSILSVWSCDVNEKSLSPLLKHCQKLLEIQGCDILYTISYSKPIDWSTCGSKSLRSLGWYELTCIREWKLLLEAFPNLQAHMIYSEKQLGFLHEKELSKLQIELSSFPTNALSLFMTSRAAANLTEFIFSLPTEIDCNAGKNYILKTIQMTQRHCKSLKILHVESLTPKAKPNSKEKISYDLPLQAAGLRILESLSIQISSQYVLFKPEEEDFIYQTIAACESLQVLTLSGNFKKMDEDGLIRLCESTSFADLTQLNINVPNVVFSKRSFRTLMKLPKIKEIHVSRSEFSNLEYKEMQDEVYTSRWKVKIFGLNHSNYMWRSTDFGNGFTTFRDENFFSKSKEIY